MAVANIDNRKPALGQCWFLQTNRQAAKGELIWSDTKCDWSADVVPTSRAAGQVDAAPIRDQPRLYGRIGRAQHNRVITERRIYVPQWRKQLFKELITGSIRLPHCRQSPNILFGCKRLSEAW